MSGERILVPVSDSSSIRQTVGQAVRRALQHGTDASPATIVFAYVHSQETDADPESTGQAEDLLDRAVVWATEDAGEEADALTVERIQLADTEYVFSPDDVAMVLERAAQDWNIDLLLLDPEYDPGIGAPLLRPLEYELTKALDIAVEEADVNVSTRRTPLVGRATALQFGGVFAVSFLFYQVLAGQLYWFDLLTGAITAGVVAVTLTQVAVHRDPDWQTPRRFLRGLLYVPYLLKEIIKSNIQIAAVILHPRLPIDPRLTRIRPAVFGALPVTTFANSVTLTPGTLSTRVEGESLLVHTLVPSAREDLFDGGLERAVRFLFYGRDNASIASPRERNDAAIVRFDGSEERTGDGTATTSKPGETSAPPTDTQATDSAEADDIEFAEDGSTMAYDSEDGETTSTADRTDRGGGEGR